MEAIWPDRSWVFNMLEPALQKDINTAKMTRGHVTLVIAFGVMLNVAFLWQFFWRWLTIRSVMASFFSVKYSFIFKWYLYRNYSILKQKKNKKNTKILLPGTGTYLIKN